MYVGEKKKKTTIFSKSSPDDLIIQAQVELTVGVL